MFVHRPLAAILCVCCIISLAVACRKKKDVKPERAGTERLLLKISDGDRHHNRMEYDAGRRVAKHVYYPGFGPDTLYETIAYANGRQQSVTRSNGQYTQFVYAGDTLKQAGYFNAAGTRTGYRTYRYENGRLQEEVWFQGQTPYEKRVYVYDARGNRASATRFTDEDGTGLKKHSVTEYLGYTEHPDPWAALFDKKFVPGKTFQPRLWQKEIHRDGQGFEEWTTEFNYTYDALGYPVRRETTSFNPDRNVIGRADVSFAYHP